MSISRGCFGPLPSGKHPRRDIIASAACPSSLRSSRVSKASHQLSPLLFDARKPREHHEHQPRLLWPTSLWQAPETSIIGISCVSFVTAVILGKQSIMNISCRQPVRRTKAPRASRASAAVALAHLPLASTRDEHHWHQLRVLRHCGHLG